MSEQCPFICPSVRHVVQLWQTPIEIMLTSPESMVSSPTACWKTSRMRVAFTHKIGGKETCTGRKKRVSSHHFGLQHLPARDRGCECDIKDFYIGKSHMIFPMVQRPTLWVHPSLKIRGRLHHTEPSWSALMSVHDNTSCYENNLIYAAPIFIYLFLFNIKLVHGKYGKMK
jgi:hypothetical protein